MRPEQRPNPASRYTAPEKRAAHLRTDLPRQSLLRLILVKPEEGSNLIACSLAPETESKYP
jgi:hypothetical protein